MQSIAFTYNLSTHQGTASEDDLKAAHLMMLVAPGNEIFCNKQLQ